ncbi:exopolysaccharide biosynthesis polyprenyl glycosylphosphotransferase [Candidatus Kaiserbacteria bacterium]|nr:exopolysaccharide biosynthesis polyprenyl glycosylphosphotransferase [Candidatus Kaiserbacteria bacterium]
MRRATRRNAGLLLLGDVFSCMAALFIALVLRHGAWPDMTLLSPHLGPFLVLTLVSVLIFFIAGLYDTRLVFARRDLPDLVLKTQVINILLAALFFFLFPVGITPKTILALYLIVSTALIIYWRMFLFPLVSPGAVARAVVIGNGEDAKVVSQALHANAGLGCVCVEMVDIHAYGSTARLRAKLTELVSARGIDTIIADMSDEYAKRLASLYYDLAFPGATACFIRLHEFYEQLFCRVPLSLVGKAWFLENIRADGPHCGYSFLKRTIDIAVALLLLVPCVVLFPMVALAIKLQDGGKVLYKTERVGQYGRPIHLYKFRTMTGMDLGMTLDTKHAVTPLGRFLRKTRIDELPQLWNIVQGDLSFVGPRPELPARARVYAETIPYYAMRHLIKPGLSGWAQINNFEVPRGEVDIARTIEKLSFDLYYLKRHSLILDLEIILKTIKTMLLRSGS